MNQYLYFSYYDALNNCVGFNIIPAPFMDVTPEWVADNISVAAPIVSVLAVVSLDITPPSDTPIWIEFYVMDADYAQEN